MMGTFTKGSIISIYFRSVLIFLLLLAFGAAGGYVGGSHAMISALRKKSSGAVYGESTSPPVLAQLISSMAIILGDRIETGSTLSAEVTARDPAVKGDLNLVSMKSGLDNGGIGTERLRRLAFNSRYLRSSLSAMGFIVFGSRDSPIVPLLIYQPGKMATFSRMMLERYMIVVVVVGYPATPLLEGRARFCVSAAHTKEDLDRLLEACDDIGSILGLRLSANPHRSARSVIDEGVEQFDWFKED